MTYLLDLEPVSPAAMLQERKAEERKMATVLDPETAQQKRALNKLELDQQLLLHDHLRKEEQIDA